MRTWGQALTIGFTYIGTIVGAGFATGQEILQFFTLYGRMATFSIFIASVLFLWLGTKVMLLAHRIQANSYADMNRYLFGTRLGQAISAFLFILLLAIATVMLAGAGAVFEEHLGISRLTGLAVTAVLAYLVILKGMNGIMAVNSFVVPLMLLFMLIILVFTLLSPGHDHFLRLETDYPLWRIFLSPFMYAGFNLSLAQAVLVPLGASADRPCSIRLGGLVGGIGITIMLFTGHIALSAHMPGIAQYDIPMGQIIQPLGTLMQLIFIVLIFAEIFTTLIADLYGVMLQVHHRYRISLYAGGAMLVAFCYGVSHVGFKPLLATLYPILGFISLGWLIALIRRR